MEEDYMKFNLKQVNVVSEPTIAQRLEFTVVSTSRRMLPVCLRTCSAHRWHYHSCDDCRIQTVNTGSYCTESFLVTSASWSCVWNNPKLPLCKWNSHSACMDSFMAIVNVARPVSGAWPTLHVESSWFHAKRNARCPPVQVSSCSRLQGG